MFWRDIERRLQRIEDKLDAHEERQNGHAKHTFKGIPLVYWLVGMLLAGVLGADFAVDVLTAFGRLGGG